ncbi:hypothetical protein [Halorarius halobius]|uniref:hypothetical protein n=1 Tax=Halorarius halobius TaxID=2962671 RepID=UPI0020CCED21|nr:hypothetical protein [Halorarius halobius]
MDTTPTRGDPLGSAVGLAVGVLVGLLVAVPALPTGVELTVSGAAVGPVGSALLVGALSVLVVPFGVAALYFLFVGTE